MDRWLTLWESTALAAFTWGQAGMMLVGALLLYLAIRKKFEPLLLLPIGFGAILANIPLAVSMTPAEFSITSMWSVSIPASFHC